MKLEMIVCRCPIIFPSGYRWGDFRLPVSIGILFRFLSLRVELEGEPYAYRCQRKKGTCEMLIVNDGPGWECQRGYRAATESCLPVLVPENAHLDTSGDGWGNATDPTIGTATLVYAASATRLTDSSRTSADPASITVKDQLTIFLRQQLRTGYNVSFKFS